jgi:uncharacterized protein with von Willebrand factor type A (vWA) domain
MKKDFFILLIIVSILILFPTLIFASKIIEVKDYIEGKFPTIFNIYLSSLEELDQHETEFIDLLEKLPKEEQKYYAKEVFQNGFSLELLGNIKESKKIETPELDQDKVKEKQESSSEKNEEKLTEDLNSPIKKDKTTINLERSWSDDKEFVIGMKATNIREKENKIQADVVLWNSTMTWVYVEQDYTYRKIGQIPVSTKGVYLFGPSYTKNLGTIEFSKDSFLQFNAVTAVGVSPGTQKSNMLLGSLAIDLAMRGFFTKELPSNAFDHNLVFPVELGMASIDPLFFTITSHCSGPLGVIGRAVAMNDMDSALDALGKFIICITKGPMKEKIQEWLTKLFSEKMAERWAKKFAGNIGDFFNLPMKVTLMKILTEFTFNAPPESWVRIDAVSREEAIIEEKEYDLGTIVLAMDRSGSMSGEKLVKAKHAAEGFFASLRPSDYSSLISFSDDAKTEVGSLQATSENKRKLQIAVRTIGADGNTNIGAGLSSSLFQLNKTSDSTSKATLLMSDGKHNTGKLWPAVEEYKKRQWPVYTVAYGNDADQNTLAEIAKRTGGIFFPAGLPNITQVYHRISAHVHNQSVLFAYNDMISQGKELSYQIPIDSDITSATFFADWQGSVVDLYLQTPQGEKISTDNFSNFSGVTYQKEDTFCFYQVDKPKCGNWQVTLFGKEIDRPSEQVNLTVSGSSPLLANLYGFQPSYRRDEVIPITVKVLGLFGPEPEIVRDIKVTAKIKKPSPNLKKMLKKRVIDLGDFLQYALTKKKTLNLHDDGRHSDGEANDGIFSAEYKEADENGYYLLTVKCEAIKPNGEKILRTLQESIQVGPIEDRAVTLADFLGF